ncbi:phosphate acetyltransferase [Marinilabiliaceae bacterium JC017]|nr:phosphate acetyltransferase [Marinilabiliaceae bacterium JC017]
MRLSSAIKTLSDLAGRVKSSGKIKKVVVVMGQDPNTLEALSKATTEGFISPILIGDPSQILLLLPEFGLNKNQCLIIDETNPAKAAELGVKLVRDGDGDILMKGLIGTDVFLKAVLNKEYGLMLPKGVLSYVCAIEIDKYSKLLFITDPAVIPFPDLKQKAAMAKYVIEMAHKFGIDKPKVALMGASEKMNAGFPNSVDYAVLCKMAQRKQLPECIMDGPMDLFLACDPQSVEIKGIETPVNGEADVLLFPTIEACNPFYKSLMLFGGGELAGLIQGTTHPVVVMSRSESALSKYYCLAMACLTCE